MKNIHIKKHTLALSILAISATTISTASAAITVTNTGTPTTVDDGTSSGTISNWDLNGGNIVVFFFSGENAEGLTVSYGTQSMTVVETVNTDRWVGAIGYIIDPVASIADVNYSYTDTGGNETLHTLLSLGGADFVAVAGSDSTDTGNLNFSYTTVSDGGYVVGATTNNDFNGPPGQPTVTSSNLDIFEFEGSASGNFGTIHVHGDIATAGTYNDSFGNSNSGAFVAFQVVPEPSSSALICLGGLALILRRRK